MAEKRSLIDVLNTVLWPMGQCVRHDVIVRYLTVVHFLKEGTLDPLYERLCLKRIQTLSRNPKSTYDPDRFVRTIRSFRKYGGFRPCDPIHMDRRGRLVQGAHRLACAIAFNCPDVWIDTTDSFGDEQPWSWFTENMSGDDCERILAALEELRDRFVFTPLRKTMEDLEYPPNHDYDPKTFEPRGLLVNRLACLREHAPEMMHGESFLDIGCNKGFFSFYLAGAFETVTSYEPMERYVAYCEQIRKAHGFSNIRLIVGGLGDIPLEQCSDVVYAGHFNHHCYDLAIRQNQEPYGFMRQLANLTDRILVVDGPYDLSDPTAGDLANKHNWTEEQKVQFSLEEHAASIEDAFELVRSGPSGTGPRRIAVFHRINKWPSAAVAFAIGASDSTNTSSEAVSKTTISASSISTG